jgi:Na+/H+ antiporter NhaC
VAIGLAIAFKQVIVALLCGVWLGALFLCGYNPAEALARTIDKYAVGALADRGHAAVVMFSLMLGGMVGVVSKGGGSKGLATVVTRFATNSQRGQISSWFMGILIFFDDYANTLLVGSTMRPITDRLKISREKLAYIVDATAAPVVSIAIVSSWVGVEIGYIASQYELLGIEADPYWTFIKTIPYCAYPILMLVFGFMIASSRRDFGPMLKAERRAQHEGKLMADGARPAASFEDPTIAPKEGKPTRWFNALVPIVTVITIIVVAMICGVDSYDALLWAALVGSMVAILLVVVQQILSIREAIEAWLTGVKAMILAMVILILAWSLGAVCNDLKTAEFIVGVIGDWLNPGLLPALVFIISGIVSFATGTSWGTMGILFPLVIPLAHGLAPGNELIMLGTISSILAGSVWGDHCSPISDTTIMSSMASSCDHIDHVRTQLPYALVVGVVGLLAGNLATGMGIWPAWVGLLVGAFVLAGIVFLVGKKVEDPADS